MKKMLKEIISVKIFNYKIKNRLKNYDMFY